MAIRWYPIQKSFKGGEISPRYFAQVEEQFSQISCAEMTNYIPLLQGPAAKRPGTLFNHEVGSIGRIIPMQSVDGRYTLVQLTAGSVKIFIDGIEQGGLERATAFTKQVVGNASFKDGLTGWYNEPTPYRKNGKDFGSYWIATARDGYVKMRARETGSKNYALIRRAFTIDSPSARGTFIYRVSYTGKTGKNKVFPTITLSIGTTAGAGDVYSVTFTGPENSVWDNTVNFNMPTGSYTGTLYIQARIQAANNDSNPNFSVDTLEIYSAVPAVITDFTTTTPYAAGELDAIQYVQSPYKPKGLILVHRNHPPYQLYWDTGGGNWVFAPIVFIGTVPTEWGAGNYPQVCTSFQGRLVLGGTPSEAETFWMSKSSAWDDFTQGTNPNDGLEVTVIYRSPAKWAHGHKNLVVGCGQFEYSFSSNSGLLTPSDTQISLQSAHGSTNVQPANLGYGIIFASEGGKKARLLELSDENRGWLAPDVSISVDHLLKSGIKRMGVVRAPQQMVFCLCNDGTIALITIDRQQEIAAWCRLTFNGSVKDLCVITDDSKDTPYFLIERSVNGSLKYYVESLTDIDVQTNWRYMDSMVRYTFTSPTTILTGLSHLEGMNVYITDEKGKLIDSKEVLGGQISLDTPVIRAVVGTTYESKLVTMPVFTDVRYGGLAAVKRFSEIGVRLLQSAIPEINGVRPPDRSAQTAMDFNEPLTSGDVRINNLGYDTYAQITITEPLPLPSVIVGIFGKLNASEV